MDTKIDKRISNMIKVFLVIAVLINKKGIFTDFDRDCAYAVVNPYRFVLGDRLFLPKVPSFYTKDYVGTGTSISS